MRTLKNAGPGQELATPPDLENSSKSNSNDKKSFGRSDLIKIFRSSSPTLQENLFNQCSGAGAASFGRSRSRNAVRLRQWY
jgi:hypothetical protein